MKTIMFIVKSSFIIAFLGIVIVTNSHITSYA